MKRTLKLFSVALALALITAACGGDGDDGTGQTGTEDLQRGGTLRIAMLSDVSAAFDPQKEYYSVTWQIMRCCLLRTLVTYPGEPTENGGNDLVPDLAEDLPEQSEDELTWTFRLKEGIHYGPPYENEEVTAQGFINALEREADPDASAHGYSFYYSVIEGFDKFAEGKANSISGVNAPDDYTLEITTTRPAGDLPFRMAMPAMAPIPDGAADNHVRDYGRFLV